jgi:hypothetical protein
MQPEQRLITITDNKNKIISFLKDLIIKPRVDIHKWAQITKQTPTLKIGYIGQHLASLILGMEGGRTGARGHDIVDGTEVKSCTKVDQADKCKDCDGRVMRSETECHHCGSTRIARKDDSKWLFSIRTDDELNQLTTGISRIFLLISDYPKFSVGDFSSIRFEAFEIYPNSPRMAVFNNLLTDYYRNNYRPKADANQTTAPMNFHPYKLQFYLCNPIKVFSCVINQIDSANPTVNISKYVEPNVDRTRLLSEDMPTSILSKAEVINFIETAPFDEVVLPLLANKELKKGEVLELIQKTKAGWASIIPVINEIGRSHLNQRDVVVAPQKAKYLRN